MSQPAGVASILGLLLLLALPTGCAPHEEASLEDAIDSHSSRVVTRAELGERWPLVEGIDEVTLSADCSSGALYLRIDTGLRAPELTDRILVFALNSVAQKETGLPYPDQDHEWIWSVQRYTVQQDGTFLEERGVPHDLPSFDKWYDARGIEHVLPDEGTVAEHVRPGDRMEQCFYAGALSGLAVDLCD